MRVCLVPYPQTWLIEGGHRTQQRETALALQRAGVDAVVGDVELAQSGEFDIVHFFGDPRPLLTRGRPRGRLVVSPVHLPAWFALGAASLYWRGGRRAMAPVWLRHRARCVRHYRGRRRQWQDFGDRVDAIALADLIVTNSRAEAELFADDARRELPPVHVAYSGVNPAFADGAADRGRELVGGEPFVLCSARVEPLKNQLSLALAMRGVPRRLLLAGAVLPGNEAYLDACRRALPSLVHFPNIPHDELRHVYAAADVHVLPSWFETTGLSTLEALAAGTPAVVGAGPCVEEYFAGCARVVPPHDIGGLRGAILAALASSDGDGPALARRFSWDRTARQLLEAYAA